MGVVITIGYIDMVVTPECYAWGGDKFYSFMQSKQWKHNTNPIRGMFYGNKYPMQVKIAANESSTVVKVYNAIAVNANKKFASPDFEDITSPPNSTYKAGIKSKLSLAHFVPREGVWYAPYQRNAITSSLIPSNKDLVNGNAIRAQWIEQNLVNDDDDEVILNNVEVFCTHSPLTK